MATRTLRVTFTVAVRDMSEDEYEDAGGESADELGMEPDDDPTDVVSGIDPNELREIIEVAIDSDTNPELLAGSGLFVTIGGASVETIQWVE